MICLRKKGRFLERGGNGEEEILKSSKKTVRSPEVEKGGKVGLKEMIMRMMSNGGN